MEGIPVRRPLCFLLEESTLRSLLLPLTLKGLLIILEMLKEKEKA